MDRERLLKILSSEDNEEKALVVEVLKKGLTSLMLLRKGVGNDLALRSGGFCIVLILSDKENYSVDISLYDGLTRVTDEVIYAERNR